MSLWVVTGVGGEGFTTLPVAGKVLNNKTRLGYSLMSTCYGPAIWLTCNHDSTIAASDAAIVESQKCVMGNGAGPQSSKFTKASITSSHIAVHMNDASLQGDDFS